MGLEPSAVIAIMMHRRHGHALYRLACGTRSFVLKWFADPMQAGVEMGAYALLTQLGVPTLQVYGSATNMLLLEDLAASPTWRLATNADVEHAATGTAVATWHRVLHAAGRPFLADSQSIPGWLRREVDTVDAMSIQQTGERLGIATYPGWRLASEQIRLLQSEIHAIPTTLVYNDFHWTNLAMARHEPLRTIVYDYHLMGIGMPYSDYRNASGALGALAQSAFQATYGKVDEREALLDAPMAILHGLQVAAERPQLPGWATALVEEVKSGLFETKLRRALA